MTMIDLTDAERKIAALSWGRPEGGEWNTKKPPDRPREVRMRPGHRQAKRVRRRPTPTVSRRATRSSCANCSAG
jgi:hypothetical protein